MTVYHLYVVMFLCSTTHARCVIVVVVFGVTAVSFRSSLGRHFLLVSFVLFLFIYSVVVPMWDMRENKEGVPFFTYVLKKNNRMMVSAC